MDSVKGEFLLVDNKLIPCKNVEFQFNTSGYLIYETMRTDFGKVLFPGDHLERMEQSVRLLDHDADYRKDEVLKKLNQLIQANGNRKGNIKLLCKLNEHLPVYALYYIPHHYPSARDYSDGIKLSSYYIERPEPKIKQVKVSDGIRAEIEKTKINTRADEILLINHENYVTEGSKSNFFLIKKNTLYSAPEDWILPGITRKYVIKIAERLQAEVKHIPVKLEELKEYEAAFICGTSPKVLPVSAIDEIKFNPKQSLLVRLQREYDQLAENRMKWSS